MFVEREDKLVRSFQLVDESVDTSIDQNGQHLKDELIHVIGSYTDINDAIEVIHQKGYHFEVLQLFQTELYERFGINAHPEQLAPYLDGNGKLIKQIKS